MSETTSASPASSKPILKMALEMGPLAVFFIAINWGSGEAIVGNPEAEKARQLAQLIWATKWFMGATVAALTASKLLLGRIPIMPLVSGIFIGVFGALTVWLNNGIFIQIKPTIVNLIFGTALLAGLAMGHALLKYIFGEVFRLTEEGWRQLTLRWGVFFFFLAALNEIVWRSFSQEFWAGFKFFGVMPLTMIFALAQMGLILRHQLPDEPSAAAPVDAKT